MSISASTVKNIAPEFEDEDDSRIDTFIGYAEMYVNSKTWGTKADYATALFTAHLLTVSGSGGSTGVTSERVGDLSTSYAVNDSNDLGSTSYGKLYLSLRKTLVISPNVIS